jgi:predicted transposase/invertase (TIGR01784 family)
MLGIDLEQTRVYQEAKAEGRQEGREALQLELVLRMLQRGMTQQEIAELLGLPLEQVRQIARTQA